MPSFSKKEPVSVGVSDDTSATDLSIVEYLTTNFPLGMPPASVANAPIPIGSAASIPITQIMTTSSLYACRQFLISKIVVVA